MPKFEPVKKTKSPNYEYMPERIELKAYESVIEKSVSDYWIERNSFGSEIEEYELEFVEGFYGLDIKFWEGDLDGESIKLDSIQPGESEYGREINGEAVKLSQTDFPRMKFRNIIEHLSNQLRFKEMNIKEIDGKLSVEYYF